MKRAKTNRDHAKKQHSPQRENKAIAASLEALLTPAIHPQQAFYRQLGLRNRLIKQRLHWGKPSLSTPHQRERWSDLMTLMTWQLWLAKDIIKDNYLPWQKPQTSFLIQTLGSLVFS
jgi:hypothetical protein